jgi:hypothetical protein
VLVHQRCVRALRGALLAKRVADSPHEHLVMFSPGSCTNSQRDVADMHMHMHAHAHATCACAEARSNKPVVSKKSIST